MRTGLQRRRITSFARRGEDIVLHRGFRDQASGFYVDVGAAGPVQHSITKLFYDRGWRGINVEPRPDRHARLVAERPRDVNLCLELETLSLDPVLAAHDAPRVDFLRIEADGHETQVLSSIDLATRAPRAIVVVATASSGVTPHQRWERALLGAGYQLTLYDGLNRFYARVADPQLIERLSAPAGPDDDFDRAASPARDVRRSGRAGSKRRSHLERIAARHARGRGGRHQRRRGRS